jgi:hypothetical protein
MTDRVGSSFSMGDYRSGTFDPGGAAVVYYKMSQYAGTPTDDRRYWVNTVGDTTDRPVDPGTYDPATLVIEAVY